jgi:Fur family ferric uptake transcriptional regulator
LPSKLTTQSHSHTPPAENALSALRARGGRLTRQRSLIWETLLANRGSHLSAAQIAEAVSAKNRALHQATVYRTLDTLAGDGLLLRTDLGGNRSYYELPAEHRHHHVVCSSCGAVAHIHHQDVETILERVQTVSGYTLADSELTFSGQCPNCPTS